MFATPHIDPKKSARAKYMGLLEAGVLDPKTGVTWFSTYDFILSAVQLYSKARFKSRRYYISYKGWPTRALIVDDRTMDIAGNLRLCGESPLPSIPCLRVAEKARSRRGSVTLGKFSMCFFSIHSPIRLCRLRFLAFIQ